MYAVIVIDMLEDFFMKSPLSDRRRDLCASINALTSQAHRNQWPVVWIRQEFAPDLSDAFQSMKDTGTHITIQDTKGSQLLEELAVKADDHLVIKKRYSGFYGTALDTLLQSLSCSHLIFAGVNTHACVRSTAVDAYQRDYRVILASDAISSYDDEYHRESMRYLAQSIGVVQTNQQIAAIAK